MTVVSRHYGFIFIKTRKTAGTSIEQWLAPHLRRGDMIGTASDSWPLPVPFWATDNQTTSFRSAERRFKKLVKRLTGRPTAFHIEQHMEAAEIRGIVGERLWQHSFKFCVERSPWDRLISLWRWRQHRFDTGLSFDAFLDLIESRSDEPVVVHPSNLPMYTIDGEVAVDRIVRFERLAEELEEICRDLGIPASVADLPRVKSGYRTNGDGTHHLTARQIDRVSRLAAREIEMFGWTPPG